MNPLGDDLLAWLVLAFGGAMSIGTAFALLRPPERQSAGGTPGRAEHRARQVPLTRAIVFIVVGGLAALWALASLVAG